MLYYSHSLILLLRSSLDHKANIKESTLLKKREKNSELTCAWRCSLRKKAIFFIS